MTYEWIDYSFEYKEMVDSWIDSEAEKFTGCDDGFDEYYKYWVTEPETKIGENFWAKIIIENGMPVGIIAIALWEDVFTISEFIICPNKRGKGIGTSALLELLVQSKKVLGIEIEKAYAVIFPKNIASQKVFEKVGFVFCSEHPDGDAWNYEYHRFDRF
jgi:RimJ/RimL family protein N-acetyltransferase